PSSPAVAVIQAVNAGPSATSIACPNALTPFAFNDTTAAATSPALRAQIDTSAPSAANRSATARPMPLLPPVTTARLPLSPRSMFVLLPDHEGRRRARRGNIVLAAEPANKRATEDPRLPR